MPAPAAAGLIARLIPLILRVAGGALKGGGRLAGKLGATKTGSRLLRKGYAAGRKAAPRGSKTRSFFRGLGQSAKAAEAAAPAQGTVADAVQMATQGLGRGGGGGDPDRDIDFGQGNAGTGTSTETSGGGGGKTRVEKHTTIKERIIERIRGAFGGGKKGAYDAQAALDNMSDRKRAIRREQLIEENSAELATLPKSHHEAFLDAKELDADDEYLESSEERARAAEEVGKKFKELAGTVTKVTGVIAGLGVASYGAVEAMKHFGQYLVRANEHLKEYSGVIASSMAEYRMHTRQMEMQRAAQMGGVIQEYTGVQMEFEKALQPIENVIDAAVMNITETLMEVVMYPVNWLTSTTVWKWIEWWVGVDSEATPTSQILDFWNEKAAEGDKDRWID